MPAPQPPSIGGGWFGYGGCSDFEARIAEVQTFVEPRSATEMAVGTEAIEIDQALSGIWTSVSHELIEPLLCGIGQSPCGLCLHLARDD